MTPFIHIYYQGSIALIVYIADVCKSQFWIPPSCRLDSLRTQKQITSIILIKFKLSHLQLGSLKIFFHVCLCLFLCNVRLVEAIQS